MVPAKYDKYVLTYPLASGGFGPELIYTGEKDYKSDFTIMFLRITKPVLMEEAAHSHVFDMYLYFLSFDPDNMGELGAYIEIGLGQEQEIHTITAPTSVYIPRGMVHCPLEFKIVDKPILFVHCTLAPKYYKSPAS
ncbi:MAG: hypothetical protein A2Z29_10045 [Chloroflexi bacterium RBG_16_56_11]|nr:MAG: hypothetical protein A2Z29_10045 [Chloroflexi bacterium RBG_16_56_11]